MTDKPTLRALLRQRRKEYEAAIPNSVRALIFRQPPAPLRALIPNGATVAVYHPVSGEASPLGYARWFAEQGHPIALPWFAARAAPMQFRLWDNPFDDEGLVPAPYAGVQPPVEAPEAVPQIAIVPLLGFTAEGQRLGQGGGHYDRYLSENPGVMPIGIGWDCQLCEELPLEPHDKRLAAIVTPTRFYGPF